MTVSELRSALSGMEDEATIYNDDGEALDFIFETTGPGQVQCTVESYLENENENEDEFDDEDDLPAMDEVLGMNSDLNASSRRSMEQEL